MLDGDTPGEQQVQPSTEPVQKRRPGPPSPEHVRAKRAKYNTNACDACKKCKLKCNRNEGERDCQRCIKTGKPCIYAHSPRFHLQPAARDAGRASNSTAYAVSFDGSHALNCPEKRSPAGAPGAASVSASAPITLDDVAFLRRQVSSLGAELRELKDKLGVQSSSATSPANQPTRSNYLSTVTHQQHEPQQPLFVGHTQSAYSLDAAKTSLTQMGISPDAAVPDGELSSLSPSPRDVSPDLAGNDGASGPLSVAGDPLLTIPVAEVCRLLSVFQEEIETLYPFVNSDELVAVAGTKMKELSTQLESLDYNPRSGFDWTEDRDISILKIAVAIAVVIEAQGKNPLSSKLIDSTDKKAAQVTRSSDVDLRDLQWLTTMSVYYFQIDEDLLAWRTIGNASRMALEMGLHRRRSLIDNYKSPELQERATRVFWCVYALDRRWSFGTGLSFALNERDIDPELPEPGDEYAHLRCLIGYARLCSKVWEALPPYGSPTTTIPLDQVQYLEYLIRNWQDSFPAQLQFNHPRLGLAPRIQPRVQRRLCVLLYLRANHLRTLVHRHHVLSPGLIQADLHRSRLVVDIAKDSIQVLVDLAKTSDIYVRQQATCNYFLLSALAVIILAVCNAPKTFSESCHECFSSAVELVRNFSRGSLASRRLWNSIRGLLPAIRALGLKIKPEVSVSGPQATSEIISQQSSSQMQGSLQPPPTEKDVPQMMPYAVSPDGASSVPNTFQMGDDLMGLFNAFGQADAEAMTVFDDSVMTMDTSYVPNNFPMEISRRFQGLI